MSNLVDRYSSKIAGTLSCFDRIVITGTMPNICYGDGMAAHLRANNIRIFDYPKYVEPMRDELRKNAERIAAQSGVEIEFIRSVRAFRKEDRIKEIIKGRGDAEGIVHIFSAMEPCASFLPWHDKATHTTTLRHKDAKCLHYYFYFIDKDFGLCYLRVPTWAPFRLQFYCNGHNWLARRLKREGIGFSQMDNTFTSIDDWEKAQEIADGFPIDALHRMLDKAAESLCPVSRYFLHGYHWSIMQCEWSSDIAFLHQRDLKPLYDNITRVAIHAVKCDDVATFLGRKLDGRYKDELGNDFHTRIQGTRIKHHMGPVSIKMYDKHSLVLRIETTANDVTFFRHYRTVEHRNGTKEKKIAPMQKTIYSLPALRECMAAANRRYLEFVSEIEDPTTGLHDVEKLSDTVRRNGRNFLGFNLFNQNDLDLIVALLRGENNISGITNRRVRRHLVGKTSAQVSRLLKRLRMHGVIKKANRSFRYYFTSYGKRVLLAALKLRELVVIPSLAGLPA